jgi:uncharacterized repeat protein (TIGR01451 family)
MTCNNKKKINRITKKNFSLVLGLCAGIVVNPVFALTPAKLFTAGQDIFPGTGTTLGSPSGGFYDGKAFWVSDRSADLSQLLPFAGALPKIAIDYNNLAANPITLTSILVGPGVGQLPAQPAFDPTTGIGYSTNNRSGRGGAGLVRFKISNGLVTESVSIATPANLSNAKLSSAAIGLDNNLYLGLGGSGSIYRVVGPQTGTTQNVQTIGTSVGGKPINGVAIVGDDLYIAQGGGLARIRSVSKCQTGCQAQLLPGVDTKQTYWAITADKSNGTLYAAQDSQVVSYSTQTSVETPLSSEGTYPDGSLQPYNFSKTGAALTFAQVAGVPTLWVGDNVATGLAFEGRIWTLPLAVTPPPPTDTTAPTLTLPADITTVATDPAGAVVTFDASALDGNLSVPVTCTPPSGSTFSITTSTTPATTVTCSASDAAGNVANGSFLVTVKPPVVAPDTTPPTLQLPADLTVVAPAGAIDAVVNYTATVTDNAGSATLLCTKASGSVFAIGTTPVECTGTDLAGNITVGSFLVNVTSAPLADTIAPVLNLPADITTVATSANGAIVTYTATASDLGSDVPVSCDPASGSVFLIKPTTVNCSATDAAGNTSSGFFTVTVNQPPQQVDTTPPALTLPADITVDAASSNGTVVNYTATATDGNVTSPATCTEHPSGSLFPPGITTIVNCTATDAIGNTASGTFNVTVNPFVAPPAVADLAVSFTNNRNRPRVGQTVTITYKVTNSGPNEAASVTFADKLSALFRISSVSTTVGTCVAPVGALGGQVSCALGNLSLNQTATVTLNVVAAIAGTTSNQGTFSSVTTDPVPNNNSATFFMTIR